MNTLQPKPVPEPDVVGKPILVAGAEYNKVKTNGESGKNEFSNSAGHFRVVKTATEMEEAGLAAGTRLSSVFTSERNAD